MRSPDRSDPILAGLRELWLRHPDQRLAQLVVNLANPANPAPEIFYMEDEALLARIEAALAKRTGS